MFIEEFNRACQADTYYFEKTCLEVLVPLKPIDDSTVVASIKDMLNTVRSNIPYPVRAIKVPYKECKNNLFLLSEDQIFVYENVIENPEDSFAVYSKLKDKFWIRYTVKDGMKTITTISCAAPKMIDIREYVDDISKVDKYNINRNGLCVFSVPAGKIGHYARRMVYTVTNFENVSSKEYIFRESDGASIEYIGAVENHSDILEKNPREFVKRYKYIKNYLSEADLQMIPDKETDPDELVEILFDISAAKKLKEPAMTSLKKLLGEILTYI